MSCEAVLGEEHPSRGNSPCRDPEAGLSLVLKSGMSGEMRPEDILEEWLAHSWTPYGPPKLRQQNPGQVPSAPFPMDGTQTPVLWWMIMVGTAVSPGVARTSPGQWRPVPAGALQCRHLATPSRS